MRQKSTSQHITTWICILSLALSSVSAQTALASGAMDEARNAASTVGQHMNADSLVHYSTGINPQDYPCARAGIISLYEKRSQISDLSRFHPKRVFAWVMDTSVYYTMKFVDWLKGLMSADTMKNGLRKVQSMARGGNPLAGMDNRVEGWVSNLSPKSEFVLKRKMHSVIERTTNADGSCKS